MPNFRCYLDILLGNGFFISVDHEGSCLYVRNLMLDCTETLDFYAADLWKPND